MNIIINDNLIHSGLNFDEIITLSCIVEGNLDLLDLLFKNRLQHLKKIKNNLERDLYIVQLPTKINLRNKAIDLLDLKVDSFEDPNEFYNQFRLLFPKKSEVATPYPVRASIQDVKKKYDKYAKIYNWDREKVLKVTKKYVQDCLDKDGGKYMQKCCNFIHLQDKDSHLAALYDEYDEEEETQTIKNNIKMKSFATD